jgi:3-oxoacyl-ACP reductase-like protein
MRLHEIIVEDDTVANISKDNFNKGYDTVNKLLTPSRWFEKGKTDKSDANKTAAPQQAAAPAHLNREAVASAVAGKELLPQDAAKIKALASQVSTGQLKPNNIDHMQLYWSLKTAYQGKPLSDDQKQMLIAFSKQI